MDNYLKIIDYIIDKKASTNKIDRIIKNMKIKPFHNLKNFDGNNLTVGSAQVRVQVFTKIKKYIKYIDSHIQKSVLDGAGLVVFPEYCGMLILGIAPLFRLAMSITTNFKGISDAEKQSIDEPDDTSFDINLPILMEKLGSTIERIHKDIFSRLAKRHCIYIMSGSILVWEDGKIFNRNYFFAPDGTLIDYQDKIHLTAEEIDLQISAGDRFKVLDLPIGKIGFPMCMDASYFETFKILKSMGAQIVVVGDANFGEYVEHYEMRDVWSRVQESGIYGVKSTLVGEFYGFNFVGRSGFFAPTSATEDGTGILVVSDKFDMDDTIVGTMDLSRLDSMNDVYTPQSNGELYRKYLKNIYKNNNVEEKEI